MEDALVQPFLFWLVAGLTGLCAVATVVTHNIVRSATWLLFTLAGTSAVFFLLGADIVGAIQLLVYVGGTLILVVFGVMLTAQGPFINMKTSGAEWAISILAGLFLLTVLGYGILSLNEHPGHGGMTTQLHPPANSVVAQYGHRTPHAQGEATENTAEPKADRPTAANSPYSTILGQGFLGVGVGPAHQEHGKGASVEPSRGRVVRTTYLFPFEIVSVHLLVVLIGAAYLARAKRRRGGES